MTVNTKTRRIRVVVPEDLAAKIDCLIGKALRDPFITASLDAKFGGVASQERWTK